MQLIPILKQVAFTQILIFRISVFTTSINADHFNIGMQLAIDAAPIFAKAYFMQLHTIVNNAILLQTS